MTPPRVRLELHSDHSLPSYAIVGDLLARTFEAAGIGVRQRPLDDDRPRARIADDVVVVQNTIGPRFVRGRARTAVALVHHEWDRYPRGWVACLDTYSEVWATTTFVQRTLVRSGVQVPVRLVRPALDLDLPPVKRAYDAAAPFRILACGAAHFRKGFHLLVEAYLKAFPSADCARLVIHTTAAEGWVSPRADVVFDRRHLSRAALLAMYARHDLFASASLGEGLGLPLAEAILAGLPVAAASWGGHGDLLTAGAFLPVPHDVVPQPFCSRPDYFAPGQRCAVVSVDGLARVLRQAAAMNGAERQARAARARAALLARYGLSAAVRRLRTTRRGIIGDLWSRRVPPAPAPPTAHARGRAS